MRVLLAPAMIVCMFAAIAAASDSPVRPTPLIRAVEPASAKCGDELVATGDYLDNTVVESLYLTLGEATFKVEILKQTGTTITFKVPEKISPGRLGLMVLTAGAAPRYIDQPVYLKLE